MTRVHLNLARAFTGKKKYKEAADEYSRALENALNNSALTATVRKEQASLNGRGIPVSYFINNRGGRRLVVVLLIVVDQRLPPEIAIWQFPGQEREKQAGVSRRNWLITSIR